MEPRVPRTAERRGFLRSLLCERTRSHVLCAHPCIRFFRHDVFPATRGLAPHPRSTEGITVMRHLSASATTIVAALLPLAAFSSSHREAPAIAGNPRVDSTD